MLYGFSLNLFESDGEKIWIAESTDLKGCIGQGETQEVAIKELESNEMAWIEAAKEFDIPIPEKSVKLLDSDFSGKLTLRLGKSLHRITAERAKNEGMSINQYIVLALTEYNAVSSLVKVANKQIENCVHLLAAPLRKSMYVTPQINDEWIDGNSCGWSNIRRVSTHTF